MTRVGYGLLTLVAGACLVLGCGATPKDININTDAESGFVPPVFEGGTDTGQDADDGGLAGDQGIAGDQGAAGAGGAAGTAGNTVSVDADSDASSDGGGG